MLSQKAESANHHPFARKDVCAHHISSESLHLVVSVLLNLLGRSLLVSVDNGVSIIP